MKKLVNRIPLIFFLLFIGFQIFIFAIPVDKDTIFWLSYGFTTASILICYGILELSFRNKETLKSKFYGFPIAKIGIFYAILQMILGTIFVFLQNQIPTWIAVILYSFLLIGTGISVITADTISNEIESHEVHQASVCNNIKELQLLSQSLITSCKNEVLLIELKKLSETLQYSDPISSVATLQVESEIKALLQELQISIFDEDFDFGITLSNNILEKVIQRNQLCKNSKK